MKLQRRYSSERVAAMTHQIRRELLARAALLGSPVVQHISVSGREAVLFEGHTTAWVADQESIPIMRVDAEYRERAPLGRHAQVELSAWQQLEPVLTEAERCLISGHRPVGEDDLATLSTLSKRAAALNVDVAILADMSLICYSR